MVAGDGSVRPPFSACSFPAIGGGQDYCGVVTAAATETTELCRVVEAYLDHLSVERGLAANTLASYARDLRRYRDFLRQAGVSSAEHVTEQRIAAFLASLREGGPDQVPLSAGSAARCVVAVRGFHRFVHAEGISRDNPASRVRPPTPPQRLPKALELDQVERILTAARAGDTPSALRDSALLELLYGTGARISEAVGLDLDDLDLDVGEVLLRGKGGKERVVPVGRYAVEAIQAYQVRSRPNLNKRGVPAVFLNVRGGRLSRQSAWKALRTAAERARLEVEVSPHTLRHSFATHLLDGGADVRVVQELLGHASVTTTQVYTLVTVDKLREVYAATHPRAYRQR